MALWQMNRGFICSCMQRDQSEYSKLVKQFRRYSTHRDVYYAAANEKSTWATYKASEALSCPLPDYKEGHSIAG